MSTFIDWLGESERLYPPRQIIPDINFPKILRDTNTKPMMHSNSELTMSDDVKIISPDYAMLYAKLVRHITEMNCIIRKDRQVYFDEVVIDLLEKEVEEAMACIKLVEKQMMNPIHVLSVEEPEDNSKNKADIKYYVNGKEDTRLNDLDLIYDDSK